ncbi:MAG: extracellular solute-binding protein, partial [Elusimicrobia bacterium]|nr:extracellular solute-binding protein [Elusimicrobiota bacterium]MBD3412203.1 extracellular solute-binding protein [Elusimicrobiota bacterium]
MNRIRLMLFCIILIGISGCAQQRIDDARTIVVWHWMTDRDEPLKELAERYHEKTGITVELLNYAPSESYQVKVNAAAQTDTLPEIFGVLDKKEVFAKFIRSGLIENLTPAMNADNQAWLKQFFSRALANNIFEDDNEYDVEPGIYGVPLDVTNIQMLYNKQLFKKAGLDPGSPPKTFDAFIAAIKKLRDADIKGMVSGWGELWMIDCFASNYAFNIMGEKKIFDTFRGTVPYTDAGWVKVFSIFETLRDEKGIYSGIVTMNNKDAEQTFALGRAAFAFNGSWCVNVYKGMNPDLEYGAMLPPAISTEHQLAIWGGAGSSFMVNAQS